MNTLPSPTDVAEKSDLSVLEDLSVRVTAVVGRTRMTIADLLNAEPGTVVELDRRQGDPVDILVNDRLIGRGEIVVMGDRLGVTMTELVEETG